MSINWNKIKTEYITFDISYRDIAEKYNVPFPTLSERAIREKWVELKKQYHNEMITKLIAEAGESEAEAIIRMKKKERKQFDKMDTIIWRAISEKKKDENGKIIPGEYVIKGELSPIDVDRFMSAHLKLQTMIYKNYGIADKHDIGLTGNSEYDKQRKRINDIFDEIKGEKNECISD